MHFKAIPTPKPRTPKQNAQEAQIPTKAPATETTTAVTTVTITAATTAIITTVTTAITIAIITATRTIIKKGKAKGRALPLEKWYKRLGHLNYADVKQLVTNSSQIKLANNKELFCESCAYGK
jgi:GAG-pre-integrase domain